MHRQWVRLSLVIIMLVVAVVASYNVLQFERQRERALLRGLAYDTTVSSLSVLLVELRAAQQAYVASGQDVDTWIGRTAALLTTISTKLDDLESRSTTPAAVEAIGQVRAALDGWRRIDAEARAHSTNQQVLMASDLVFADGRDLARRAASHLDLALSVEREAREREHEEQRSRQLVAVLAGIGVAALAAIALFPRPASGMAIPLSESIGDANDSSAALVADPHDMMREKQDGRTDTSDPGGQRRTAGKAKSDGSRREVFVPDLTKAASVCTDLARLSEPSALGAVLGRACEALDASGLILWISDARGQSLRAVAGYGYAPEQLARMGQVPCDGDNVTAAAFRTAKIQVLSGDGTRPAAMAAPLPGGSSESRGRGCLGVLSLELEPTREANQAVQATVSILAAQLATLVAADAPSAEESSAQAHAG